MLLCLIGRGSVPSMAAALARRKISASRRAFVLCRLGFMARLSSAARLVAGVMVLLVLAIALLIASILTERSERRRPTLPVGNHQPAICLSERHGLILASDGSLWTWGADFLGWPVLGLGNGIHRTTRLRRIGSDTNWVSISAGTSHNIGIKSDGTTWIWGRGMAPQLARGGPISAPVLATPGNDWKQAAAGGIHTIAIKKDGTLWGWGNNWAGSVGIASRTGSFVPVQIGSATNWTKVWASGLESLAMQSDGSLWYWGENPDPAFAQTTNQVFTPTRTSPDTNWVDVGFGLNTVFGIKSDGTLWAWGRHAEAYTGARDPAQNAIPARVGSDSDWQSISASAGWWCQGLIKKDGSLWLMDASDADPNGPRPPYKGPRFRRIEFPRGYIAYAGGAAHAAAPGVHGLISVVLTPDGEVWTQGLMLGDPQTLWGRLREQLAAIAQPLRLKVSAPDPPAINRKKPWRLEIIDPPASAE